MLLWKKNAITEIKMNFLTLSSNKNVNANNPNETAMDWRITQRDSL